MRTIPLRHLATVTNSNVDKVTDPDELPVRLCNYVDVYKNDRITNDMDFMAASATPTEIAKFRLRVDDVIITKDSEERSDIAVPAFVSETASDLVCGYHLALLRARPQLVRADFLFWAIQSKQAREAFSNAAGGITRFGLTIDGIKSVPLPCPDLETQKTIADFLDRETARIDQLIEKKQRLVSLTKEKRSVLITAAVTGQFYESESLARLRERVEYARGLEGGIEGALNRDRRASEGGDGVRTIPIRHLATVTNSNVDKVTDPDELPVRLCNYVDVYKNDRITNDMDFMAASATPTEITKFRLRVGDVIITKDSEERSDIAVPAFVSETASDLVCGYHLALLRARPQLVRADFLFWAIQSKQAREAFSNAAGGITRFGLTIDGIKSVPFPCPDLETQKTIADFLDRETARIDQLIDKTEQSMTRLLEFRGALITAAVAGQIGVTTWGKQRQTSRRLDQIEEKMTRQEARA